MEDFNIEILSADNNNLYVNNKVIYTLEDIINNSNATRHYIKWIYNLPDRRFLFELRYTIETIIKQVWLIFDLKDNQLQQVDIISIIDDPDQNLTKLIDISEHPAHNGTSIVNFYLKDDRTRFKLVKFNDEKVFSNEIATFESGYLYNVLFSSSSDLNDYIITKREAYSTQVIILNTEYKGQTVIAYINIDKPLIIVDTYNNIEIQDLSSNKVIQSFKKQDYKIGNNVNVVMVGDDETTLLAINNRITESNILLIKFTASEILDFKIDINNYGKPYIDFYGISIFSNRKYTKSFSDNELTYQLFDEKGVSSKDIYYIDGNIMAANHELYEAKLKELIAETEIYLPLQNIVEEYL